MRVSAVIWAGLVALMIVAFAWTMLLQIPADAQSIPSISRRRFRLRCWRAVGRLHSESRQDVGQRFDGPIGIGAQLPSDRRRAD